MAIFAQVLFCYSAPAGKEAQVAVCRAASKELAEMDGLEAAENNFPPSEGYRGHRSLAHEVPKEWILLEAAQLLGIDIEQLFDVTKGEDDE